MDQQSHNRPAATTGQEQGSPFTSSISRWFFAAVALFMLYLGYRLVAPFLVHIFLALVIVVMGGPLFDWLVRLFRGRRTPASLVACVLLTAMIALPFFFIAGVITSQALDLYTTISHELRGGGLEQTVHNGLGWLGPYVDELQRTLGVSKADVLQQAGEVVRRVSSLLYSNLTDLLRGATNLVIGFALMMFVTFYLFIDGANMMQQALALSPLPEHMNQQVRHDMLRSIRTTLKGSLLLAVVQGVLAGIGFWVFGVPNALFWGTVMAFSSVVPLVGTGLVWAPAGVFLILTGSTGAAVGVMVWCFVSQLLLDNLVRPRIVGGSALHPLLTFFSILGGLTTFGLVGIILGPLVLALLLSLIEIYQRYFLQPAPVVVTPAPGTEPPTQVTED